MPVIEIAIAARTTESTPVSDAEVPVDPGVVDPGAVDPGAAPAPREGAGAAVTGP